MARAASTELSARLRHDIHEAQAPEEMRGTALWRLRQEGFDDEKALVTPHFAKKRASAKTLNGQSIPFSPPSGTRNRRGAVRATDSCRDPHLPFGHSTEYP